jgi:hypothetical protein
MNFFQLKCVKRWILNHYDIDLDKLVPFDKLEKALTEAKNIQKANTQKMEKEKYERDKEILTNDFKFLLAQKDAEINQWLRTIEDLELQIKNNQLAYQSYYQDGMEIKRAASDLSTQMERFYSKSGEIYQSIVGVKESISEHNKIMQNKDVGIRVQLGLPKSIANGKK